MEKQIANIEYLQRILMKEISKNKILIRVKIQK